MPYQKPGQTHATCKAGGHTAPMDDFRGRWRETPHGTVWHHNSSCKLHEETERHSKKHENLALYVLTSRANSLARKTKTTQYFILDDPRGPCWRRLLPILEAFLNRQGAYCVSCGHPFDAERDTQLDHIHAPRTFDDGRIDWARHHARNIRILCGSCNNSKGRQPDDEWIDQQFRWQLADVDRVEDSAGAAATELVLF